MATKKKITKGDTAHKPARKTSKTSKKPVQKTSNPKPRTVQSHSTRNELEHEVMTQLVRYCRIWRYKETQALEYCKSQGHPMSSTTYYQILKELREKVLQGDQFTQQALDNLRIEHGDSLELLNHLLDVVIQEIRDHSATAIFRITGEGKNKSYVFAKNHNSNILAKLITTATDLMTRRDNTLLATPVINDLLDELEKGKKK